MEKQTPTPTLADRLFAGEPAPDATDESVIRCEVEETETHFRLLIPKRIPVEALAETRSKNGPGNLVQATLEAPAITCELYGADGRSTKLVTKPVRTRLSFRLY